MTDFTHLQPGDHIAVAVSGRVWPSHTPQITHRIYRVTKRTPTQAEAVNIHGDSHSIRVRASDGKVIGEDYVRATIATPELIEQHHQQVALRDRWYATNNRLDDLTEVNLRKLTLEQREALADAWERVKAMPTTTTP